MRQDQIQLFKPQHLAVLDLMIVLSHIFKIALCPFALSLLQTEIVDRKLFITLNIRSIYDIETVVSDIDSERNILSDDKRETACLQIAFSRYGHTMSDQSVGTIEIFDNLRRRAVASDRET